MRSAVLLALSLCPTLATAKPDPELATFYEHVLQELPTEKHTVPEAPQTSPSPWRVGQWAVYRHTDAKGNMTVQKTAIVARDDCGWWVENVDTTSKGRRDIVKICYTMPPQTLSSLEDPAKQALDLVQVVIQQGAKGSLTGFDFRTPEGQMMRNMVGPMLQSTVQGLDLDASAPKETIEVRAGTFAGSTRADFEMKVAFVKVSGTTWVHPTVPVNGLVKTTSNDGSVTELVDFGQEGASSALPDVWTP